MNVNNKLYLNVKTDPNYSDILRNTYDYIIPAYHMNKEHWNTIIIDEKVDEDLVKELIEQSYKLTKWSWIQIVICRWDWILKFEQKI